MATAPVKLILLIHKYLYFVDTYLLKVRRKNRSRRNKLIQLTGSECLCRDWHGCIMQQSIVGQDNIHPYKFSECSLDDYIAGFRDSRSMCLLNKPNEVKFILDYILANR